VSCYVKRRQPPDLFPDDLNCLLNSCDCSATVVGDERLPSSSINRALASLASSHISLPFVAYSPPFSSLLLHHGQEQERQKFVAPFRRQAEARADHSLGGLRRFRVLASLHLSPGIVRLLGRFPEDRRRGMDIHPGRRALRARGLG
jgi:hypothetical protein